jgi:hypothetical protein
MGDKVSIPRSFADNIGVADTLPSIRRHYMAIPLYQETTTGVAWPYGSNSTTGIPFLQRNATFEKIHATCYCSTSFTGGSTVAVVSVLAGGTTVAECSVLAGTTTSAFWSSGSTAADNPNMTASQNIRVHLADTHGHLTRTQVAIVFRERENS